MTVAVLSDIHSNYYAFQACYEDAVKCGAEMFVFLGDYVSDLSEPQRTMDLVYEIQSKYPTVCLRGNREGYMLDCESGNSRFTRGSKSGSLLYTYDHLRKKDLDFIRGLKISDTVVIDGVRIEMAHAAMDNDRYYFDNNNGRTAQIFPQMKCKYLLTGHSHKQYIKRESGKTIINAVIAGLLHDIAYCEEMVSREDRINHGRRSAAIARPFLENLGLPADAVNEICYGIAIHVDDEADFEWKRTPFCETVGDADNIDRFDVYRVYESLQYMKFNEMPLEEKQDRVNSIIDKLTRYKDLKLGTETAKKLWIERLDYQLGFYDRLKAQLENSTTIR